MSLEMWNRFTHLLGAVWHGELVLRRMFNNMPLDAGCRAGQMLLKLAWLLYLLIYYGTILDFRTPETWDEEAPLFWFGFSLLGMSFGWYGLMENCISALVLAEVAHHCTWTMAFSMCWVALHLQSCLTVAVALLPIAWLSAYCGVGLRSWRFSLQPGSPGGSSPDQEDEEEEDEEEEDDEEGDEEESLQS